MGVEVVAGGATESEAEAVRALFAEHDEAFSRFRAESELCRVNASEAAIVAVSPLFARVAQVALDAAAATDGLVDPTVGIAIEAAGYDRDWSQLTGDAGSLGPTAPGRWQDVRVTGPLLWRPPGVVLDLNGVVKAVAVDDALGLVGGEGFVSAGGDLATRGAVVVGLPDGEAFRVLGGGMATSGTTARRWRRGGEVQHHLIDPGTGRPSRSCWTQVTVAAGSCLAADVAAKAAFLLSEMGPDWLDERGLPGRFVGRAEEIVTNGAWRRSVPTAAAA